MTNISKEMGICTVCRQSYEPLFYPNGEHCDSGEMKTSKRRRLDMRCEYKLTGWKQCGKTGSHIHTVVHSLPDGGTKTSYQRRCADHSEAKDKDIHTWTTERMEAARKELQ